MRAIIPFALVASAMAVAGPEYYRITNLPGLDPSFKQEMFSGSINLDANQHSIFFWFIRAKEDSTKKPIAYWFTGGPGCSSLSALMTEQGPFWPNENGTVSLNDNAWTNQFNMVFVDSPAGVGYSSAPSYVPTDRQTADDAYEFITKFNKVFTDMAQLPVYITGESYAGHYVPNLVVRIIKGNDDARASGSALVNLQGFMVGNAWTDASVDNEASIDYWTSHSLLDDALAANIKKACDFSSVGPILNGVRNVSDGARRSGRAVGALASASSAAADCDMLLSTAMDVFTAVNIYAIYADTCPRGGIPPMLAAYKSTGEHARAAFAAQPAGPAHAGEALRRVLYGSPDQPPAAPCIDFWGSDYLNDPAVKAAIHAPNRVWHTCSDAINGAYSRRDVLSSVIPQYKAILDYASRNPSFKGLVYTGDNDAIVSFVGSRRWWLQLAADTGSKVMGFKQWLANKQLGGFVNAMGPSRQLVYASVRGAGHMVPSTQPYRGSELMRRFLDGTITNGN